MGKGSTPYVLGSEAGEGASQPSMGPAGAMGLGLLTYLAPGLPLSLFGVVADHLRRCPRSRGRQ